MSLVYVSAFAPDEGETMKALVTGGPQPAGAAAIRPDAQGFIWLDRDGFVQYFAPDVDPAQARVLAAVQKPIAASSFLGEESAWKALPSWYLVPEQDQMIPPDAQRFMAQRTGATIPSSRWQSRRSSYTIWRSHIVPFVKNTPVGLHEGAWYNVERGVAQVRSPPRCSRGGQR